MLVDWFTVGAQALNFIVLVALMRRFLFAPIRAAIDARAKSIADELAEARATEAAAELRRDELTRARDELETQRATLMERAAADAEAERQRLLAAARVDADAARARREEAMRADLATLRQTVRARASQEVFAIARRALTDLSATSLEDRVLDVFLARLRRLDGTERATLRDAVAKSTEPVVVRSAFELGAARRAAVEDAVRQELSPSARLRFETAPELVSGIELATTERKIGWSVAAYLTSLEEAVAELETKGLGP